MLKLVAPLVAAISLGLAGPAAAASVILTGQLVSEGSGPKTDPNLSLGDQITAIFGFDAASGIALGDTGLSYALMTSLTVGNATYRIPIEPDFLPFSSIYVDYFTLCTPGGIFTECSMFDSERRVRDGSFGVVYKGNKIYGLTGSSTPTGFDPREGGPDLRLGSIQYYATCVRDDAVSEYGCYGTPSFWVSDEFHISRPSRGPHYVTQGFTGLWDYSAAQVSGVPEPATWAMMIVGFGFAGIDIRRRRKVANA